MKHIQVSWESGLGQLGISSRRSSIDGEVLEIVHWLVDFPPNTYGTRKSKENIPVPEGKTFSTVRPCVTVSLLLWTFSMPQAAYEKNLTTLSVSRKTSSPGYVYITYIQLKILQATSETNSCSCLKICQKYNFQHTN